MMTTDDHSEKNTQIRHRTVTPGIAEEMSGHGYEEYLFDQVSDIPPEWLQSDSLFLQRPFLAALEAYPPAGMQFRYACFRNNEGKTIAVLVFQVLHFNAAQSLGIEEACEQPANCTAFFPSLRQAIRKTVARRIDFYTIVHGNLLLTGDYSAWWADEQLNEQTRFALISSAFALVRQDTEKTYKRHIPVSLMKEWYPEQRFPPALTDTGSWYEFRIQPNMLLHVSPDWHTFDDYLQALSSKYRVRARRAFGKAQTVRIRYLDPAETWARREELFQLYKNIANEAGFNMVRLHPEYLHGMLQSLPEDYRLAIFELDGRALGFFSYFINGREMVAHYVGFAQEENRQYQLYLNMLFHLIDKAISHRLARINFGRTAMEIKSSVGAVAEDLYCYIRHRNKLYHRLIPELLHFLSPQESWVPRTPFR